MSTLREYNGKIASLNNTGKITGAMKMIAATKLQKTQVLLNKIKPYRDSMTHIASLLEQRTSSQNHILSNGYPKVGTVLILLLTSDRGLCGSYNSSAIKLALQLRDRRESKGQKVMFCFAGAKGATFFKRRKVTIFKEYQDIVKVEPTIELLEPVRNDLMDIFLKNEVQEVWGVFSKFHSAIEQQPELVQLLPFGKCGFLNENQVESSVETEDYICEPDSSILLEELIPGFLQFYLYDMLIQSLTSEHSARMTAMDGASSNCVTLIDEYTRLRNKARQASITTELTEIVSSKEAMSQ